MKLLNAGKFLNLSVDDLQVHPKAQRAFDEKWANKLAATFDPDAFGALTIVRVKGKYYIVDGQHRWMAARSALGAGQLIPCMVFDVETPEEAAGLFLAANKHKNVKALDKFFVQLVRRDANALAVQAILKKHDLAISRNGSEGCVRAVDACISVFNRQRGAQTLDRVIGILRSAWGRDADAYHSALIRGLGVIIAKYGEALDDGDLARKLAKECTPLAFIGKVRALQSAQGSTIALAAAAKFIITYNKGRRGGALAA